MAKHSIEISAELAPESDTPAGPDIEFEIVDPPTEVPKRPGGKRTVVFSPPDINVLVILLARVEASNDLQLVGTMINTFFSMIHDEDDVRYFNRRLFDPRDNFNAGHIARIMSEIVEGWSGNPTDGSSESSESRPPSGKKSKHHARGRASTHGTAPSTAG